MACVKDWRDCGKRLCAYRLRTVEGWAVEKCETGENGCIKTAKREIFFLQHHLSLYMLTLSSFGRILCWISNSVRWETQACSTSMFPCFIFFLWFFVLPFVWFCRYLVGLKKKKARKLINCLLGKIEKHIISLKWEKEEYKARKRGRKETKKRGGGEEGFTFLLCLLYPTNRNKCHVLSKGALIHPIWA